MQLQLGQRINTGEKVFTAAVKEVSDGKKDYCECYKGDFC